MKGWTFSRKVSVSIALASLIVAAVLGGFVYITFSQWTQKQEKELLSEKLKQFELQIKEVTFLPSLLRPGFGRGSGAAAVLKPDLSSFAADLDEGQTLQLLDDKGRVLAEEGASMGAGAETGKDAAMPDGAEAEKGAAVSGGAEAGQYEAVSSLTLPVFGTVTLRLADSGYSAAVAASREVGRLLLLGLLLAAGAAALAGWLVACSALKPIRSMIGEVQSIGADNLSHRLALPAAQDELHQLGATFNALLQKLSVSFEQQRRFVADASHELKTPLAIIEGHTHMIQRWGKQSPEVLEESLGYMMDEAGRMRELIAQLLLLAETEEPVQEGAGEECDVQQVLHELLPQTVHVGPGVTLSAGEAGNAAPLPVRMPAGACYQVLRNIVENALKYTPEGGSVRIAHKIDVDQVIVSVTDTGTGISSEQLPHIFDRFYRAEGSRNRAKGGSGLGLAIAKAIMERYGGSIAIESIEGAGTKVVLSFVRGAGGNSSIPEPD
ncbi:MULTISPECIES: HAMP domain-containing sensor histidine kinase [unclassified Paenibacillus]|uniref:sensor histidine kinase n=1 Tax=unclassified Paenibacillus TaxID=185978 RepID=UPI002406214C|nr:MULTISPECIES: HAMP domain-containing sensor histidine kinase [unclassified Paenibacillus]MDF9842489.1 two-component system sensor histidine kinase ArlS [Paenibacillus sp. PastF-2]MDF9849079.1 two-component system sensor histidine kinase ArlS [Paenibacillus sp. PastM-2]MDF9855649.1 two-component system sensor histidine kinase ArlS [Paenibacillus sp. PastF-1]MDH6480921.1 two-component system sensor histidine kinase ArlS [Paenibacillus sp. PastH-2]MDH6508343.1 two-component system sensor histi